MHPIVAAVPRQAWRQLAQRAASSSSTASSAARLSSFARQQFSTAAKRPIPSFRANSTRSYSSSSPPPPTPPRKKNPNELKFWPFLVVIALGSGGYILLANKRNGMPTLPPKKDDPAGLLAQPSKPTPTFSPDEVTVIFVLGGPGAGKGTQCANLVKDYGFTHLSAGDLLRAEQDRPGSQFGELIKDCIKNGAIVPMEVTVQLLENAMTEAINNGTNPNKKFLIDGFPRKMDQALKFEEVVCPAKFVLFYDCPEEEMERRLLERGKTSGRSDDNIQSIKKRFRTFIETSMPVVDHYEKEGRVVKITATAAPQKVYEATRNEIKKFGI
ncbi:uridylate kinase [Rhypophila decipiens]